MNEKEKISLDVNVTSDLEIQCMDFLSQIMARYGQQFEQFGISGDVDISMDRIAKWFLSKYSC